MTTYLDFVDPGAIGRAPPRSTPGTLDVLRSSNFGNALDDATKSGLDGTAQPRLTPGIDSLLPDDTIDASAPYPDQLSPWDVVYLSGYRLPGIARVDGLRKHKTDAPPALGSVGAMATGLGFDPCEITITLTLWTPAQFEAMRQILPKIQPELTPTGYIPRAVYVTHPGLTQLKINMLYLVSISIPRHTGKQIFEQTLQCIEFLPPKPIQPQVYTPDVLTTTFDKGRPTVPATPKPSQNPAVIGP